MARQRSVRAFPTDTKRDRMQLGTEEECLSTERSGVIGFLSDRGVRETIESIIIAVILALLFRAYEAEAFVIPTGSMAPVLQGRHRDIECEQCKHLYQTGELKQGAQATLLKTICPICQYPTTLQTKELNRNPDHATFSGDRILVNKFVYDFSAPKRFDVIVFKNPNNGKQNYIKRLVGLPGDNLVIENGDIFDAKKNEDGEVELSIIRKPAGKLAPMLQLVDDTNHIGEKLIAVDWPLRWNEWHAKDPAWDATMNSGKPNYVIQSTDSTHWLRYRHLIPLQRTDKDEWDTIELGDLPPRMREEAPLGRLISDYYCYNHRVVETLERKSNGDIKKDEKGKPIVIRQHDEKLALQWVGDLAFEADCIVKSNSGEITLELVEGGVKFQCVIDLATGKATLQTDSDTVDFQNETGASVSSPTGDARINNAGKNKFLFANVDDQLFLSVNKRFVKFDASTYVRSDQPMPRFFPNSKTNLGDAEPASIGAKGVSMEVTRLKVLRDIYYTSPLGLQQISLDNENNVPRDKVLSHWKWFDNPTYWERPDSQAFFKSRFRENPYIYQLAKDQFLPMGDNSPSSLDGRVWDGPKFVSREYLIGRALFIYWPHSLNTPIKFFPNFKKMKFIR